ncbi:glycoside hydrolase family 30 beta sandwich domain-containing protein [Parabacteroides sp. AM08-6]|uniref:glycoside hydrolase family 30 protein n=1 Tax=Parabacteroides sp. AM08-6 TaxID=2292053 RepID=UPI000EFE2F66|nr:glycoside hydrolase family 30 protein [Parabacteroides sp. AM08-6]RHJ86645.1 beta-glycosidase [Parabacteroides sp. AM08-6]
MKTHVLILTVVLCLSSCTFQPHASWMTTTEKTPWQEQPDLVSALADTVKEIDVTVRTDKKQQMIDGFGACFNELGWISLSRLEPTEREKIMEELFFPDFGANFTICRMPVGANDFSRDWYSYNEADGDFEMKNFTIANDQQTLVPFIKNAQKYKPDLRIWASPWCPPSWMKYNKHYASAYTGENMDEKYRNGLPADKIGHEGTDMFIQEDAYLKAYALYFSKFINAYKEQGVDIFAVMPQNEFNSAQIFPSCCWTAASLANFVGNYLGPAMRELDVQVMFGTMERANEALVDTILTDASSSKYVSGVGFQWAGRGAIKGIHERYPDMKLYQTEQECGDGRNDWRGAEYSWNLMRHYFDNGVSAYMYWNISLEKGGISRWGWAQNSLVVVDPDTKSFQYTPEYYIMKHLSHYVQPGAYKVETEGTFGNLLAFVNPDESVVVALANDTNKEEKVTVRIGKNVYQPVLAAHSVSTLLVH